MKKLNYLPSLLIGTAIAFTGCKDENVTECDVESLVCTEIFTTVNISVTDSKSNPFQLDSIAVTKIGSSTPLFTENPEASVEGLYKLISDAEMESITKEGSEVNFEGFKAGVKVVDEDYKVGHNCCHVVFIQGQQDVTLAVD